MIRKAKFILLFFFFIASFMVGYIAHGSTVEVFSYLIFSIVNTTCIYIFGGVDRIKVFSRNHLFLAYSLSFVIGTILLFSFSGFSGAPITSFKYIVLLVFSILLYPTIAYSLYSVLLRSLKVKKYIVFGDEGTWQILTNKIIRNSLQKSEVIGYLDIQKDGINNIDNFLMNNKGDNVICILSEVNEATLRLINKYGIPYLSIGVLTEDLCRIVPNVIVKCFEQHYILSFENQQYLSVIRILDIVLSLLLLILASPLLFIAAIIIKLIDGGDIFFFQERRGYKGKKIKIFKLRSMDLNPLTGKIEYTKSGKLFRKLRLNEVPQLINVLLGEMSIVGPRPDVEETYQFCTQNIPYYHYRTNILPGITGHAQIHYKYLEDIEIETFTERLAYDLYYVKRNSPYLYILTLLKTIESILFARGK